MRHWFFCMAMLPVILGCNQGEVCTTTDPNVNCTAIVAPPGQLVGDYEFLYLEIRLNNGGYEKHEPPTVSGTYSIKSNGTYSQTITQSGSTGSISGKFLKVSLTGLNTWAVTSYFEPHTEDGQFELKGDTLVYSITVSKYKDPKGVGFVEFDVYLKTP